MSDPIGRLNAALEGRYRIESELGEGGMATVYLADDIKHGRKVALKVLKPELAAVVGAERFLAEIKTTANLQHPHILPLHDSGEADGFLYYVMPYIEGESLREKLDREHQLPVDEAVRLTTDIATALGIAHEQAVIHRDIKPANILLSRGEPLVADFGIALAVGEGGGSRLTQTGLSIGTPHYMSPEQAGGASHIDARSDIYSVAAMMYEMLAGEPPYTGPTAQVVLTKRLTDPIPSVRRIRDKVPASVDAAIQRGLAPVPADRFATMGELTAALTTLVDTGELTAVLPSLVVGEAKGPKLWTRWAAAGVAAALLTGVALTSGLGRSGDGAPAELLDPNSIVVLPFADLSADGDQEYMSDGIAEELLNLLKQIPELTVISRTTAFSFKNRGDLTLPQIAEQLGVAHVLEGSVRTVGNVIRISASLVDPRTELDLFSSTFEGTLDDIFALQDSIAAQVVSGLRVSLLGDMPTLEVTDPEAYRLFLQGRHIADQEGPSGYGRALTLFERVLEIDPEHAPTHLEIAVIYLDRVIFGEVPPELGLRLAEDAIDRALSGDADLGYAHTLRGALVTGGGGDLALAAGHHERALELAPTDADVLMGAGKLLLNLGRFDESIAFHEYVTRLDPLSSIKLANLMLAYWAAGRFEEAAATTRTVLDLSPDFPTLQTNRGLMLLEMRDLEGALAEVELEVVPFARLAGLVAVNHALGRQTDAESALQVLREDWGEMFPQWVAIAYVYSGDADAAFEWLDRVGLAAARAPVPLAFLPPLPDLYDDPRWTVFLERIGQSPEQLAAISFEVRLPERS